ncbi:kinesin light chain 1 [Xylariaceae sp. AK1471]|nr:kinesin light chain 1 [Xylariaceae sp. AK1471]
MRLLQRQDDGSFTLTKDLIDSTPPYAILSHTWGEDDEEVVFKEIIEGVGQQKDGYRQKSGYRKIDFCAKWAAADGLQYFWIDSCCIDKSSGPELQEAITSMFRWYQNAAKCYVYLSDVMSNEEQHQNPLPRSAWESTFRKSRWFTRGWTLQELLAPRYVEFYSKDGHKLGSRAALNQLLQEVTGIAIDALNGETLSKFSISERMLWSRGRETKRKEDKAYSLLGIFDVSIYVNYGEGEQRAMDRLRGEIDRRWGSQRNTPGTQKTHFMVPFGRNDHFVGREAILEQLLEKAPPSANKDDCQRTAVEGLGGIGKTQVALEAAYRVRDRYPDCSVFWVPVVDLTSFENAYREIGQLLQLSGINDNKADVKMLVKTGLSHKSAGSWLLIIDNADDIDALFTDANLADCLPFSREGSILFTSRNHKVTVGLDISQGNSIAVPKMDSAEATKLLRTGLNKSQISDTESTKCLLNFLTNLPLAIKQASAFIASNTNITVSLYLEFCKSSNADLIDLLSRQFEDRHRYKEHARKQNPVATTWLISFEYISRHNPLAADYLKFICFLAEKDIPLSLLPVASKIKMAEAVGTLKAYAFIIERDTPDSFDIHRLVRLVMRSWLQERGEWEEWTTNVVQRLTEEYPFPEHENRRTWTKYLPHGQAVLEVNDAIKTGGYTDLLHNIAESCLILVKYSEAERLYRQTLRLREEVLGREHPSTLSSMNNLAMVLRSQGKYEEAEKMHRQTLNLREEVLGREHPFTLNSMNNLALILEKKGKYEEAEKIHRQTLNLREEVLGREHPFTLTSMNGLAVVLDSQGKYEEAEKIYRQTLRLRDEVLGRNHPFTLNSMNNLAIVLYNQKKYEEAEKIQQQTLKLMEKVLSKKHPNTLGSMDNLAIVLQNQGKYEEAEKMHRQTLNLREEVLGREHPSTLNSINNLALVLRSQGKYEEAKKMHQQSLELYKKVLGREHPFTLDSMNNLAKVLRCQEKYEEAEKMYWQTLKLREEVLGKIHPDTLDSINNLAEVFRSQGKYEEAEEILALKPV